MAKYYFQDSDSEYCYTLQYLKKFMQESGIKEMQVFEAKRENDSQYFFCNAVIAPAEKNGTCGKFCGDYLPRNGKNGCCKHYGCFYVITDKAKTIKLKDNEHHTIR